MSQKHSISHAIHPPTSVICKEERKTIGAKGRGERDRRLCVKRHCTLMLAHVCEQLETLAFPLEMPNNI